MVRSPHVVVIGLTGGIGSGKSTVAALLAERGAAVVDADDLAHEVMEPGEPAYAAVVERFGSAVVAGDGRVDRRALAGVVFADDAARADLEAIVHPAVSVAMSARIAEAGKTHQVVVAVVPLLVEAGWEIGDAVVVVDCPEDIAVSRLVDERGMDPADARRRVAAQATREQRLARADHVIRNDGSLADLRRQVDALPFW
jgi:dephospho-CoA kinase